LRDGAVLKGADHSALGRARDLEALGFLSGEVSLAGKPEELLIAIAHRCRKLIKNIDHIYIPTFYAIMALLY
jgi:hypothetical protein